VTNDTPSITGLGLITPLGGDCDETFNSLMAGKFIEKDSRAKINGGQGGNVNELAFAAAQQAMNHAGWKKWPDDSALIVGTSKGDIESWLSSIDNIQQHRPATYPWNDRLGLGDLAATLAHELRAENAIRLTYSAACASALHALARAVMMIQSGEVRSALVVAAESSLHPLFQGCFHRLGVLAPAGEPCRPFDATRRGFHISQAAAAICIEATDSANPPIARIDQIALAGDAWHLTGSDPEGHTLRRLLASIKSAELPDLIHAHGTGTEANDAVELAAIESVLSDATPLPVLYSHKAALGHSLGASGLISVVLNCLIHQHGFIPGNICTTNPLNANKLILSAQSIRRDICRSLVLAGGFGGATAVVGLYSE
jgi:3-oxoacyl-[acyl-carrier-protein] synthase II